MIITSVTRELCYSNFLDGGFLPLNYCLLFKSSALVGSVVQSFSFQEALSFHWKGRFGECMISVSMEGFYSCEIHQYQQSVDTVVELFHIKWMHVWRAWHSLSAVCKITCVRCRTLYPRSQILVNLHFWRFEKLKAGFPQMSLWGASVFQNH